MSKSDGLSPVISFYSLRLSDLVYAKAILVISCRACRQEEHLKVIPLIGHRGPRFGVRDLERVVTCAQCKRQGFAMVRVEWL